MADAKSDVTKRVAAARRAIPELDLNGVTGDRGRSAKGAGRRCRCSHTHRTPGRQLDRAARSSVRAATGS